MNIDARLAGAPISWGVCEVPGWGMELDPDRVLREMSSLGIRATELGAAGYLPTDPVELRAVLSAHDLRLVAGFVPVVIHDPLRRREGLEAATASARTLATGGADVLVSAIVADEDWGPRIPLDDDGWRHLLDGLAELDQLVSDHGLVQALHPHVGTLIQEADEVQRVLDHSDVGWCLDSGHLYLGGYDPVTFAEQAAERVRHVHLKDVDGEVARAYHEDDLPLVTATQRGLFVPLGEGDARVDDTVRSLEQAGYDGWYVLEQDTALTGEEPPIGNGPVEDVRRCVDHLRRLYPEPRGRGSTAP
jgi:inosose dehydratase